MQIRYALCCCAALLAFSVDAQDYPSRPVRILANGPGGGVDLTARLIAQGVSVPLGQPVVVDNRGGALVIAELVAKAPPDGYTLYVTSGVVWLAPFMQSVPYDPLRDFAPISLTDKVPNVLVVHPSLPVHTLRDLIVLAKSKPGALDYASAGTGGSPHLSAELFKSMARVDLLRVPYKAGGAALNDLISGQVQIMFATGGAVAPLIKSGSLRAIAVTSPEPSAFYPGVPTMSAAGLPGYESETLYGMFAPASTPAPIVHRLSQEVVRYLGQADVRAKLFNAGLEAVGSTPEEFAGVMSRDMQRMSKVIRDAGIKGE
jgi:tripartite-type tricarboxylate transporter receptor subunit TctC